MSAVKFTKADKGNLELVRQIVLRRLKDGQWNQLYEGWDERQAAKYVVFDPPQLENEFFVLVLEVMWQLIGQGVITPGINAPNPALPWFRVTGYGKKVLEAERFIPHDPSGYIDEVRQVTSPSVGKSSIPYIEEALRCFTSGCNVAAIMMLGIAAESVFLDLCAVVEKGLAGAAKTEFEKLRWVKPKHRWIVERYNALPASARKKLPESLQLTLLSLYELIRQQRNEVGHPSKQMPKIDREKAFVYFKLFPPFISDIKAFASYCNRNSL